MKAELNDNGCLTVTAETGIESFALKMWALDYFEGGDNKCSLLIAHTVTGERINNDHDCD